MNIKIIGATNHSHKTLRKAARHYGGILLSSRLYPQLDVTIQFKRPVKGDPFIGYIEPIDSWHKPREFLMVLPSRYSLISTLNIMAHESVHIRQYATDQLYHYDKLPDTVRWKGERLNTKELSYWAYPWEIEARGLERVLYEDLRETYKTL